MKATIEIDLEPIRTPNYVLTKKGAIEQGSHNDADATKFHVRDLSPEVLDKLCDEFRRELFKKAGKQPPPQVDAMHYCADCPEKLK